MYVQAFHELNPRLDDNEEYQYMIEGWDFVYDLLFMLDVFDPIRQLMVRCQSLDTPVWKMFLWWPKVQAFLLRGLAGDMSVFPRLQVNYK